MFKKEDIIHSYTTRMAVADGMLVKLEKSQFAAVGIKFPVYLTRAVWDRYIEPEEEMEESEVQQRIHAMLVLFANKAKNISGSILKFTYYFVAVAENFSPQYNETTRANMSEAHKEATLKSVITAQDIDNPSPAIFIMLPLED